MRNSSVFILLVSLFAAFPGRAQDYGNSAGLYKILLDDPKQVILGLGVEIQSDSIGSGNNGLPEEVVCVPHDLVESEKIRLYTGLLQGFRYLRLAMGLYLRGNDPSKKYIIERYEGQMKDLATLIAVSGMEGADVEYWSPAPYWKSNGAYINGALKSFDSSFLSEFGDALVTDIKYLQSFGVPVAMWSLQNEPPVGPTGCTYSCCGYSPTQYYDTFKVVGPMIKKNFPNIIVHADSWGGQDREALIANDTSLLPFVDMWSWHRIGDDSNDCITNQHWFLTNTQGKPVINTEYEYFNPTSPWDCINTAQDVMNWFVFENSPTWFWLHALKPTVNSEASGFGLGYWRPPNDDNTTYFPELPKGYFEYNDDNFNSLAGFLKYMPWNSQRYTVAEDSVSGDQRILAFQTTNTSVKKLVFVITNRWQQTNFTFDIQVPLLPPGTTFDGHLYNPDQRDADLGSLRLDDSSTLSRVIVPLSIEFWVQR